jgi:hypothetical protein
VVSLAVRLRAPPGTKTVIAFVSFRGACFAREPGTHEHGPAGAEHEPVFMGPGPGPDGPSRNDDLAVETTGFFVSIFMAGAK